MFTHTKAAGPKDYEKLKEYKLEARRHGVTMAGLDINKSKKDFVVHEDGVIYYGFNKIKNIGEEAAQRLEELQPYHNFEDFLYRFGTAADPVKAVIALGCFPEHDRITLYKFYEYYKKILTSKAHCLKNFEATKAKLNAEILACPDETIANKLRKKLKTCIAGKEKRDMFAVHPSLATFKPEEMMTGIKLKEDFIELLGDEEQIETAFYGYVWQHPLEKLTSYSGLIISDLLNSEEKHGHIEVVVRKIEKKKGAKATYYSANIEDATGYKRWLTLWADDYERFSEELRPGSMVRLHLDVPKPPFQTLTMHMVGNRWRKPPKQKDYRVVVLK
jgi:DNA polymerase III alpha subunit